MSHSPRMIDAKFFFDYAIHRFYSKSVPLLRHNFLCLEMISPHQIQPSHVPHEFESREFPVFKTIFFLFDVILMRWKSAHKCTTVCERKTECHEYNFRREKQEKKNEKPEHTTKIPLEMELWLLVHTHSGHKFELKLISLCENHPRRLLHEMENHIFKVAQLRVCAL